MNSFTQNSVYPQNQLQQAQQMATGLQTQASSGALTIHTLRSSSQNSTNQAFETALLSGESQCNLCRTGLLYGDLRRGIDDQHPAADPDDR